MSNGIEQPLPWWHKPPWALLRGILGPGGQAGSKREGGDPGPGRSDSVEIGPLEKMADSPRLWPRLGVMAGGIQAVVSAHGSGPWKRFPFGHCVCLSCSSLIPCLHSY